MEKLDRYRQVLREIIDHYSRHYRPLHEEIEHFKIMDQESDHYQLVRDGWWNHRRYYGPVLHFQIKDGKIWILHDGTEQGIVDELLHKGVDKEDVVFGFHAPSLRHLVAV
jgi:hypothetical protein